VSDKGVARGGRPRTIQTHIEHLMASGNSWSPAELCTALHACYSADYTSEQVQSALQRMLDRGAIERVSYGVYRVVSPKVSPHYRSSMVTGAVLCSKCHCLINDTDLDRAGHTKFHNTWTR
jgi:hypothetical protein